MRSIRKSLYTKALELVVTEGWGNCLNSAASQLELSPVSIT
jgi:hypothetical protein